MGLGLFGWHCPKPNEIPLFRRSGTQIKLKAVLTNNQIDQLALHSLLAVATQIGVTQLDH